MKVATTGTSFNTAYIALVTVFAFPLLNQNTNQMKQKSLIGKLMVAIIDISCGCGSDSIPENTIVMVVKDPDDDNDVVVKRHDGEEFGNFTALRNLRPLKPGRERVVARDRYTKANRHEYAYVD